MEPVTHFLTGACLGRAGCNRKSGLATLTLVLASEAPDLDMVSYFGGSVAGLEHHRGITHTLLGAPFMAGFVVAGVYGISRLMTRRGRTFKLPPRWGTLYVYALLASLLHILMDYITDYGVRPFAPFNSRWYSWDIVFIFDPIMLGALFLGLVGPLLFGLINEEVGASKRGPRGRGGAIFALACLGIIAGFRNFEHRRAVNLLESFTVAGQAPVRASAFPFPVNPFQWNGVVETRDVLEEVLVDPRQGALDSQDTAQTRYKPTDTPATLAAKGSRLGRVYMDWARYPVVESERLPQGGYEVTFTDLRFAYIDRSGAPPLRGHVLLDEKLNVLDMWVGQSRKR